MRRVHLTASGLVQSVFFRASTRDEARRLTLTGWIRNTADGAVTAEVQGEAADVELFVAFCRRGPGHARVDSVEIAELDPRPDEHGFTVA